MHSVLLSLNFAVAMGQVIMAAIALKQPRALSHSGDISPGEKLYSLMFAARTVPFGLATSILPFYPGGPSAAWIVISAAIVQVLDALIGVARKERLQIMLASFAAIVHGLCAASILVRA